MTSAPSPNRPIDPASPATPGWLVGGGKMGELINAMDWSATPLGPLDSWPQSLRTTVSLCLASNFPISLVWGPQRVQIYNDGYWPLCGAKHPAALGQDIRETWASVWPVIGTYFDRALAGESSFLEDQRMFVERNGYPEETFFTFSFSPIRDESGGVGGLFHPVTETTGKMLSQRRARALRDLAARLARAGTVDEALALAVETFAEHPFDIPFAVLLRRDATAARPGEATGTAADSPLLLAATWPLAQVFADGRGQELADLAQRAGGAPCGPYPEPPVRAMLLPLLPPGTAQPLAALVLGLSPRLPVGDSYRVFLELLAASLAGGLATVLAREEERRRAAALTELDRAKTTFFANISHEFRTPLTLMLGPLADALRRGDLPPGLGGQLDLVQRNGQRLLKLVNTLLDFARSEAGRTAARFAPTDLPRLVADLASAFRPVTERAGLTLTVDAPPLGQALHLDRDLCERIVLNLLSNAVKFTLAGGITVRVAADGPVARLVVADTGVGVPAAELPRMFERFHRVAGVAGRSHEGSGIGLALVRELAQLHGGTVAVASEPGRGTTFTVTFPFGTAHLDPRHLHDHPGDDGAAAPRTQAYIAEALDWLPAEEDEPVPDEVVAADATDAADDDGPRPRLLLADDNPDMRRYLGVLLAPRYAVQAVADGREALAAALADPPDLVLSDVMMPHLDGIGLLRALRADPRTAQLPIVLLSARAGEEAVVEGLATGADDYLVKPFSARELLARIDTHLAMARARAAWAQELERANRALEAFSYSVSHDLRTPLRAIDGFSRLLLDATGRDPEEHAHLQRIRAATRRMGQLIDDLLSLSRVGRSPCRREAVDLGAVARGILARLAEGDPARQVAVAVADGLVAEADPGLAAALLDNLLGNAWKYTARRPDARISFCCSLVDGVPAFHVADNGAGFDMAHAGKLFTPFQRLHAERDFPGTGIGLAIVQRIVERHGGRVWAVAAPGAGATFSFTFGQPAPATGRTSRPGAPGASR